MKSNRYSDGGVTLAGEITTGINIIWVSQERDYDQDGVQDDQGFVDILNADGHNVDVRLNYWDQLDAEPEKVDELNAADVVIVSRSTASGDFNAEGEAAMWNSVTAPVIQMSAYLLRSSRWLWVNSTSIINFEAPTMQAVETSSPLFDNIELDADNATQVLDPSVGVQDPNDPAQIGQTTFLGIVPEEIGNGIVLANTMDGIVWIAVWKAGVEYYDGAGQIPAGKRMMFPLGTQEIQTEPFTPWGAMNLNENGQVLLRNAIMYLTQPLDLQVAEELLVDVSAADPSAGTDTWVNNGTLGDFNFITEFPPGSTDGLIAGTPGENLVVEEFEGVPVVRVMSGMENVAAYMGPDAPASIIGGEDRSVEVWVADLKEELPKEQCLLAWGKRGAGDGANCSINLGYKEYGGWGLWSDDYDTGFNPDALPTVGTLHHLVYVIDGSDAKLYVDGLLNNVHTMAGPPSTPEATINLFIQNKKKVIDDVEVTALDKKGLLDNVVINSIRVHSSVLTDAQVLDNYTVGPAN
jgi:hypothetical protein